MASHYNQAQVDLQDFIPDLHNFQGTQSSWSADTRSASRWHCCCPYRPPDQSSAAGFRCRSPRQSRNRGSSEVPWWHVQVESVEVEWNALRCPLRWNNPWRIHQCMLYMVTWIPSTKTTVMLAFFYQHHGSVMGNIMTSLHFFPGFVKASFGDTFDECASWCHPLWVSWGGTMYVPLGFTDWNDGIAIRSIPVWRKDLDIRDIKYHKLYIKYPSPFNLCLQNPSLVGGAITILKYEFVNGKDDIPYIMENKTCLKLPIRSKSPEHISELRKFRPLWRS